MIYYVGMLIKGGNLDLDDVLTLQNTITKESFPYDKYASLLPILILQDYVILIKKAMI